MKIEVENIEVFNDELVDEYFEEETGSIDRQFMFRIIRIKLLTVF